MNSNFWKDRKVFITGHTGFKGGWMALWLTLMGAKVYGYSLQASKPSFFSSTNLEKKITQSFIGDIINLENLKKVLDDIKPSIIMHMAAQPLVRESYNKPLDTLMVNVMGTANIFEAARLIGGVDAIVNITSDKCYENNESNLAFKENSKLGGYDPYSSSKACSELVTSAYRKSFFSNSKTQVASVRAGNVIGGGDWNDDRLIPDFFKYFFSKKILKVRYPNSIRPWQHVLEPISGYLILAEKLVLEKEKYADAWNFGPNENEKLYSVNEILEYLSNQFEGAKYEIDYSEKPHESKFLKLDSSKSREKLGWNNYWNINTALDKTSDWYKAWHNNKNLLEISISQIKSYEAELKKIK